jgi:hypothetical protein
MEFNSNFTYMIALLLDHEDGGAIFLPSIRLLSLDCTPLYPRSYNTSSKNVVSLSASIFMFEIFS